jgi:hypothetical protein
MTDQKGKQAPADDRTLLDPLDADELKALREAREKLKGGARGGAAILNQQIGPDAVVDEDDIGDAPTRAIMKIPSFDEIQSPPGFMAQPKPMNAGNARVPTSASSTDESAATLLSAPSPSDVDKKKAQDELAKLQGGRPSTGPGGFGDNTLMWMAPIKPKAAEIIPERGAAAAAGMIPTEVPKDTAGRKAATALISVLMLGVVVAIYVVFFGAKVDKSAIEFVTNPAGAIVSIDGKPAGVPTPMRAEIRVGLRKIEINMKGFKTESYDLMVVKETQAKRENFDLYPLSQAGLTTVSIEVSPVAANVTLDETEYPSRKTVRIPDIDPKKPHKLTVISGGFDVVTTEIPAGQLKALYKIELKAVAAPE